MSFSTFHVDDLAPSPSAPSSSRLPAGQLPLPAGPWPVALPYPYQPPTAAAPAPTRAAPPGQQNQQQHPPPTGSLGVFGDPEWASPDSPNETPAQSDDPIQQLLHQSWKTFEEAKEALMEAAETAGFGVSKLRPGNYDKYTNQPRSHSYECYKGRTTQSKAGAAGAAAAAASGSGGATKQVRKRTSIREGCPWKCKIRKRVKDDSWRFIFAEGGEHHSHPLSDSPEKINSHLRRKVTPGMIAEMMILKTLPRCSHADVAQKMNNHYKDIGLNLTRYHVNNTLKKERDRILRAFGEDPDKGYEV